MERTSDPKRSHRKRARPILQHLPLGSPCKQRLDHPLVGIESLVCQQGRGRHIRQQCVGAFQIMGLARRQDEVQRIAQRIDKRMNLGAQPAFAAPDRLAFAVFFCAPALC